MFSSASSKSFRVFLKVHSAPMLHRLARLYLNPPPKIMVVVDLALSLAVGNGSTVDERTEAYPKPADTYGEYLSFLNLVGL